MVKGFCAHSLHTGSATITILFLLALYIFVETCLPTTTKGLLFVEMDLSIYVLTKNSRHRSMTIHVSL